MTFLRRLVDDRRRGLVWWSLGLAVLILLNLAFYPSIKGTASYDDIFKDMPDALKAMMGNAGGLSFASPAGYLNSQLYALMLPLILLVYGIGLGASVIAGAEEDGTLELVLAEPVTRRRVAIERVGAWLVLVGALDVAGFVATIVPAPALGLLDGVGVAHVVGITGALLALIAVHAAIAFAAAGLTGRKVLAQGIAGSVAALGYVAYGLEQSVDWLRPLRFVTPWHWYLERNLLLHAPGLLALWVPIAVTAALVTIGVGAFERRDLRLP